MADSGSSHGKGQSDRHHNRSMVIPGIIQTPHGVVTPYQLPNNSFPSGADSEAEAKTTDAPASLPAANASPIEPASTSGFLGGANLAEALGVHPTRSNAFFWQLERRRLKLGDDSWHEVRDPRPNAPRFIYRVDSPLIRSLAARYQRPNSA